MLSAKSIGSRVIRRRLELALGRKSDRSSYISWIILIVSSIIFALIIFNWLAAIRPPEVQPEIDVSVRRLDHDNLEVMIVFVGKDTMIKYLTYNTSQGSGFINKSTDHFAPLIDIGDTGVIYAGSYSGALEIYATFNNGKTVKIYVGQI